MRPQKSAPVTLSRKRRRRVRSRQNPSSTAEAEDERWQVWSDDSVDFSEAVPEAELTAHEIALMSSEIDKILTEAKLTSKDVPAEEQLTATSKEALQPPLPVSTPQTRERRSKKTKMRPVPSLQGPYDRDLPAPLPRQRAGQKPEPVLELGKAPSEPWEPIQATVLKDDLDQPLAFNRPSGVEAMVQVPGPSRMVAYSAPSNERFKAERPPAPGRQRRSTPPTSGTAPPASAALAADDRACPWCTSGFTPTFPALQAGLVCDDCKFTCAACGRRAPVVNFTRYCVDCSRPIRPGKETCRICQDQYAHQLHEQEDPYCNCQRKDFPRAGRRGSKKEDQVPFAYTTPKSKPPPAHAPTKPKKATSRANARNLWTTSNTTTADHFDTDSSEMTEPSEKKPIRSGYSAPTEPTCAPVDGPAKFHRAPRFSPSACHECQQERCPACGCPGQTDICNANVWYACQPEPNTCCCPDVPYSAGEMFAHQAPLTIAPHACGTQGSNFQPGLPTEYYPPLPPDCFAGTSFRREQTWTEGGTVRKLVVEQIEQPGGFQVDPDHLISATAPLACGHSHMSIPSQFSTAPTSPPSSWGRTLDFSPEIISRRYSYASCVPEEIVRDITWSTTRLGSPFSWSSSKLHKTRRSSSLTSKKPALSEMRRRASSVSIAGIRKASVSAPGRRSSVVLSTSSRKSSILDNASRRSSVAESHSRKGSFQEKKTRRSSFSSGTSRKHDPTEETIPVPGTAKSSRRLSRQLGFVSVDEIRNTEEAQPGSRRASVSASHERRQSAETSINNSKESARMLFLESNAAALESSIQEKSSKLSSKCGPKREREPDISTLAAKPKQEQSGNAEASELSPPSQRTQSEKPLEGRREPTDHDRQSFSATSYRTASKISTKHSATSHRTISKLSMKQSERSFINNSNEGSAEEHKTGAEQLEEIKLSIHSAAELAQKGEDASHDVDEEGEDGEDGEVSVPAAVAAVEPSMSFSPPDKGREYNLKEAEETLEDFLSTTRSLYPESRFVIALAILCILWVVAIIVLSTMSHTHVQPHPTDTSEFVPAPTVTVPGSTPFNPRTPETEETSSVVIPSTPPTSTTYSCSTPYCEREGAYIKSLLSSEKNPCENFYDYVCDAWKASARSNVGTRLGAAVSRDTILEEEIENKVIEYLRSDNPDVLPAVQLHRACIESTQHEITEVKVALKEMFKELPGETWPVPRTDTSLTPPDVWLLAGKLYREFGIDAFLGITIGRHQNSQPLVILELPQTFFYKEYETDVMMNNMFRDATTEAAVGLFMLDVVQEVTEDVYTVFRDLAQRYPADAALNFTILTVDDIPSSLLTFLQVVFDGVAPETIVVRSPDYILTQLQHQVRVNDVPSLINYLGFRLIVRMAPFFPSSGFENLKLVFSLETTGRVRTSPLNNNVMCLRAVAMALPVCVVKAHARVHMKSRNDLTNRIWLSQLENSFFRNTARLSWVDDLAYSVIRFRLGNTKLARFFPSWSLNADQCNGSISNFGSNVAHIYRRLSEQAMKMKLGQVDRPLAPREPGFPFDTRSRYSWGQQTVYVPLGLINSSVPSNGTLFAFHLSRTAVRFFHSLAPLLWQEPTALGASYNLEHSRQSQHLLDKLLECLCNDFSSILERTRVEVVLVPYEARYALFAQTVALSLAFIAFHELLHVERIWKMSFRLSSLPDLSSDQLFFIWYALDNCEESEPAYQLRQYETWQRLPPDLAVNFPLRHLPQFGEAFHCQPGSGMQPPLYAPTCNIFNTTASDGVTL